MKTKIFIYSIILICISYFVNAQADWNTAGNNIIGTEYLGGDNTSTIPLDLKTVSDYSIRMYTNYGTVTTPRVTITGGNTSTGGYVGIGTTSPNYLLHQDAGTGNDCYHQFTNNATSGTASNNGLVIGLSSNVEGIFKIYGTHPLQFFTSNTQRMEITGGGKVGIGTGSAQNLLHQHNNTANSSTYHQFTTNNTGSASASDGLTVGLTYTGGVTNAEFNMQESTGDMNFLTNNTQRLTVQSGGNIGIGITAPQTLLHQNVSGNSNTYHTFTSGRSGSTSTDGFKLGITDRNNVAEADIVQYEPAAIRFWTTPSGSTLERMMIGANGYVGVGTNSPGGQFHVKQGAGVPYAIYAENNNSTSTGTVETIYALNNTVRTSGSDINRAGLFVVAGADKNIGIRSGADQIGSIENYAADFYANAGGKNYGIQSIADNAGVGASATINYGVIGSGRDASSENYGVRGVAAGSGATNYGVYGTASAGANNYAIYGDVGGTTTQWAGYFNGAVFSTTAYTPSDSNLKTNVQDLTDGLAIINQLSPKTFEFKTQQQLNSNINLPTGNHACVISQDLEQVFPDLVTSVTQPAKFDDAGNQIYPSLTFKGVNYTELIPYLIQAIKQQQAQIDALTSPIAPGGNGQQKMNIKLENEEGSILYQNQPNPFRSATNINYYIPEGTERAVISFYNNKGNMIKEVEITEKGQGTLEVNADNLSSDMYSYSLVVDGKLIDTKKMVKTR
jgi:hypothetical protein